MRKMRASPLTQTVGRLSTNAEKVQRHETGQGREAREEAQQETERDAGERTQRVRHPQHDQQAGAEGESQAY